MEILTLQEGHMDCDSEKLFSFTSVTTYWVLWILQLLIITIEMFLNKYVLTEISTPTKTLRHKKTLQESAIFVGIFQ
jgi:hypothetical protein